MKKQKIVRLSCFPLLREIPNGLVVFEVVTQLINIPAIRLC